MKLKNTPSRVWTAVFLALVFLSMLLFFTVLHPVPIMDGDDMVLIVRPRPAIPIPNSWNPSRVLPETLMPLCGLFAGLAAALGLGSFIDCQIVSLASILALFITLYAACFLRLLRRRFAQGRFASFCLTALFLLLHFAVFRSEKEGNLHLFHSYDACCVFFYTIPALLNASLLLYFLAEDDMPRLLSGSLARSAALVTGLYFAIFSNLFGSAVLACFAAWRLLTGLLKRRPLRELALCGGILLAWLCAALLEAVGGRAGSLTGSSSHLLENIRPAWASLAALLGTTGPLFRLLLAASVPGALAALLLPRGRAARGALSRSLPAVLFCLVCALPFHLRLAAAATPMYAGRPEAAFPLFFLLLLLPLLTAAQLVRLFPRLAVLLPLAVLVSFSLTNTDVRTFADSNPMQLNGKLVAAVENDICEQILTAARAGEESVTVEVLRSGDLSANWPHNPYIGNVFASIFLKFGLIDRPITVVSVPSEALNARYGLTFP